MSTANDNSKTRRSITRWARIALMAIAFVVCCNAAYQGGRLLANWRHPADAGVLRHAEAENLGPLSPALPLAGIWSFDELDWSMRSEWISEQDIDARFEDLTSKAPTLADQELPDSDQEFLTLATALGVKSSERDGNRIYRLQRPGLRAQWITREVEGRTKTAGFAAAYPSAEQEWQLVEFAPRSKRLGNAKSDETHLLPLPSGAQRDGGRFAADGQPLLEFVSLDATAEALIRGWKDAGWEVRRNEMAEEGDFSYLAARGDEVIYAWSSDPADALTSLMLVRTPDGADTGP